MKISKIEQQKNNDKRVNVFVDGNFLFGIDYEVAYMNSLKEGMEVSADFLNNVILEEEKLKCMSYALNYLSFRKRSEKEVRDHLLSKDFQENIVDSVVDRCLELKYIDDLSFAESFSKDKVNINKLGEGRIKYELRTKGVDDHIIEEVLEAMPDEYDRCLELANKRVKSYKKDDYQKKYRKLQGYLARRGYSYSVISDVLKEVL